MDRTRKIEGIIFDFDGLIIDSETPAFHAWQRLYEEYELTLMKEDWVDVIGWSSKDRDPMHDLARLAGDGFEEAEARKKLSKWEKEFLAKEEVLPGVRELITAAENAQLKLGIASSSSRQWVKGHLERLGLYEHFEVIISSDDVDHAKPDPEIFHLAVDALGVNPDQVIVLEDSPAGVLAAKRANLFCIAVPNQMTKHLSFQLDGHQPDMKIDSLRGLRLENFLP
ncbi:MAG: HAD family phosphatase [Anaerolineales bacterium]